MHWWPIMAIYAVFLTLSIVFYSIHASHLFITCSAGWSAAFTPNSQYKINTYYRIKMDYILIIMRESHLTKEKGKVYWRVKTMVGLQKHIENYMHLNVRHVFIEDCSSQQMIMQKEFFFLIPKQLKLLQNFISGMLL